MSIHSLSRTGIETEVSFTVGFCRGLALAMGFTEAMSISSLVSIDYVTYLSTPFTILTQEAGIVLKQRWDLNFNTVSTFLRIHPLTRVFFSFRGIVYYLHKCCFSCPSVSKVWKYCPISTSFKPASEHYWDNFWSSDNCSNFSSYSYTRFPCCCALV